MLVEQEDKLILTPRDAATLGFQAYSDDRNQGGVSNLVLNLKESFVLIPTLAVKLGDTSCFPRETEQHELLNVDDALFYRSKRRGGSEDVNNKHGDSVTALYNTGFKSWGFKSIHP